MKHERKTLEETVTGWEEPDLKLPELRGRCSWLCQETGNIPDWTFRDRFRRIKETQIKHSTWVKSSGYKPGLWMMGYQFIMVGAWVRRERSQGDLGRRYQTTCWGFRSHPGAWAPFWRPQGDVAGFWEGVWLCKDFFGRKERVLGFQSQSAYQLSSSPVEFRISRHLFLPIPSQWPTQFIFKAHTRSLHFQHHPHYPLLPPNSAFQIAEDGRETDWSWSLHFTIS